jgi:beta-lactam-binding protein with PASTA domain
MIPLTSYIVKNVAVLDGKYEILSQHTLSQGESVFDAVAPDGTSLRISWFELSTAQEEMQFERYRQLLRKLERKGLAAIHDIVSRPGTHYVAWYTSSAGWGKAGSELEDLLKSYNYSPNHADIRQEKDKSVVYNLGFNSVLPALEPTPVISEPEPRPKFKFPDWAINALIGLVLALVGVLLGIAGFVRRANDVLVSIPELVGEDIYAASSRLYDLGLSVSVQAVSSDQTPGMVVASDPVAGSDLRPGRNVLLTYTVSPGQVSMVRVPQLGGEVMSGNVQQTLEKAKLNLGQIVYIHAKVPDGIILSQTPEANSQTDEGSRVHLLVSLGPVKEKYFVPDLVGLSYAEALDIISLAGLASPKVNRITTTRYLPDTVIEQSIPAHTLISNATTVLELSVATQEPLVDVGTPLLVGLTLEQAKQIAAGFTLYVQEISTPSLPQGVIDQTPPPGPPAGNAITVVVNVAPVPIPVPSPYVVIKEPEPRKIPYRFYIEAGISKNSYAQVVAENIQGQRNGIVAKYVSEGERIEGVWETTYVGPITFTLYLNNLIYDQQTINP